jgi:hypothetical protein
MSEDGKAKKCKLFTAPAIYVHYVDLQAGILHLNFILPISLPLMPQNMHANICTLFVTGGTHYLISFCLETKSIKYKYLLRSQFHYLNFYLSKLRSTYTNCPKKLIFFYFFPFFTAFLLTTSHY